MCLASRRPPAWKPSDGPIAILGAGGAARAIIVAMLERGAKEIRLINRTFKKAQALAKDLGPAIKPIAWEKRSDAIADVALLTNATNQGMTGKPTLDISLDRLSKQTLVSDLIYVPLETHVLGRGKDARQHHNQRTRHVVRRDAGDNARFARNNHGDVQYPVQISQRFYEKVEDLQFVTLG